MVQSNEQVYRLPSIARKIGKSRGGETSARAMEKLGDYYEWTSAGNTKYYYANGQRMALRRTGYGSENGLFWLFTDHDLAAQDSGSTSLRVAESGESRLVLEEVVSDLVPGEAGIFWDEAALITPALFSRKNREKRERSNRTVLLAKMRFSQSKAFG